MSDEIRYEVKDAKWAFGFTLLDKLIEALFILALVFFAYNCDWCGGPRMWE